MAANTIRPFFPLCSIHFAIFRKDLASFRHWGPGGRAEAGRERGAGAGGPPIENSPQSCDHLLLPKITSNIRIHKTGGLLGRGERERGWKAIGGDGFTSAAAMSRMRSLFETPRMPQTKSEEEELAELMQLGINHPARRRYRERAQKAKNEARERAWNPTPMRYTPPNLRGIRCVTKEPWSIDEQFYQRKTGSFEDVKNDDEAFDDRSVLSASKGYTSQVTSSGLKGSNPAWNSSPLRQVPHALKGLKPETREPWAVDQSINRDMSLEGFSVFSAKVENDSVAGNFEYRN
jgi:hypothetical protein